MSANVPSNRVIGEPNQLLIEVPHVAQEQSWDCGLACMQMVCRFLGKDDSKITEDCKKLNIPTSIWTIDLALLAQYYGIQHKFTTVTLGVDKSYATESFYQSKLDTDEKRVNALFTGAEDKGLIIEKRSVETDDILKHIASGNILIILVDWCHLYCNWCDRQCVSMCGNIGKCFKSYHGHYIVVCGYNKDQRTVQYKNPSYNEELCCCSLSAFDTARKSFGTDEDILFIYKSASGSDT
ncbi:unnamed protein product [Owenia fusiformis]|nr:unnamed protein product [Owenia fusiformis]